MKIWQGNKVLTVTVQPGQQRQVFSFPEEILNVVAWEAHPLGNPMPSGTLKTVSGEHEGATYVTENGEVAYHVGIAQGKIIDTDETIDILIVETHNHEHRNGMILEAQYVPMSAVV